MKEWSKGTLRIARERDAISDSCVKDATQSTRGKTTAYRIVKAIRKWYTWRKEAVLGNSWAYLFVLLSDPLIACSNDSRLMAMPLSFLWYERKPIKNLIAIKVHHWDVAHRLSWKPLWSSSAHYTCLFRSSHPLTYDRTSRRLRLRYCIVSN